MVRTQIQLSERTATRLKALAAKRGVSMAELVRESVEQYLVRTSHPSSDERQLRAIAVAGRFRADEVDLAERHDQYLAEDQAE
ncbi:MAG: ribbon-helix-helix protein, CopG family [Acidobacteria bacterium]|nr:MAG: ribbon-helix-helix protein, CopG family [Acidobacteriota bacterium]